MGEKGGLGKGRPNKYTQNSSSVRDNNSIHPKACKKPV